MPMPFTPRRHFYDFFVILPDAMIIFFAAIAAALFRSCHVYVADS